MKMETVIRSPQKGVIKKLAHKEGVSVLVQGVAVTVSLICDSRTSAKLARFLFCLRRRQMPQNRRPDDHEAGRRALYSGVSACVHTLARRVAGNGAAKCHPYQIFPYMRQR